MPPREGGNLATMLRQANPICCRIVRAETPDMSSGLAGRTL